MLSGRRTDLQQQETLGLRSSGTEDFSPLCHRLTHKLGDSAAGAESRRGRTDTHTDTHTGQHGFSHELCVSPLLACCSAAHAQPVSCCCSFSQKVSLHLQGFRSVSDVAGGQSDGQRPQRRGHARDPLHLQVLGRVPRLCQHGDGRLSRGSGGRLGVAPPGIQKDAVLRKPLRHVLRPEQLRGLLVLLPWLLPPGGDQPGVSTSTRRASGRPPPPPRAAARSSDALVVLDITNSKKWD